MTFILCVHEVGYLKQRGNIGQYHRHKDLFYIPYMEEQPGPRLSHTVPVAPFDAKPCVVHSCFFGVHGQSAKPSF